MKHLKKNIFAALIFVVLLNLGVGLNNVSSQAQELEQNQDFSYSRNYKNSSDKASQTVTAYSDDLLGKFEKSNREFRKSKIGNKIVYFHQRMIDEAIVEKDFIVYQFDRYRREFIDKKVHWQSDLPEYVVPIVTKKEAEFIAEGDILSTKLYIISPESDVFPLSPTPENPCWVVKSIENGNIIVTIIDAMYGAKLGYGVPPPYNGFALSGPWAQDPQTLLFYELAHGGSYAFAGGCSNGGYETIYAKDIEKWIASYPKKLFVFLGSCGGMCYTGDDSLSYEFRKGSLINTTTVGYCGMSDDPCDNCWGNSIDWQNQMFSYICQGYSIKEAFNLAIADYPMCIDCVRFAGDDIFILETYIYPAFSFYGEKVVNESLLLRQYINILKWESNPLNYEIDSHRIYEIEVGNWKLIKELSPSVSECWIWNVKKEKKYTYAIVEVYYNKESMPLYVAVK